MLFFITFYLFVFNLAISRENDNEHNPSIGSVSNARPINENMNRNNYHPNTYQIENVEDEILENIDITYLDSDQILNEILNLEDEISENMDLDPELFDFIDNINMDENIKDGILENMDFNPELFDFIDDINMDETIKDEISENISVIIKEKVDVFNSENNLKNDNIFNLTPNENSKNIEITSDENEFKMDVEASPNHLLDPSEHHEHNLTQNTHNFSVHGNLVMNSNDKVIQEYSSNDNFPPEFNHNETTILSNTLLEEYLVIPYKTSHNLSSASSEINPENGSEIEESSCETASTTLYYQQQPIADENVQSYYYINDGKIIVISNITLDNNKITTIPDLLSYKECLESLSMKYNFIDSIPKNIAELKVLKKLDLSHNRIDIIYCEMKNMKLEWLDLSYNYLTSLGCKIIFAMITLKYLNLQNNFIEFVGQFNSKRIENLNISNNPISWISGSFYELPNIIELFMSNIKLRNSGCFNKISPKLKVLDLSYNKFNQHNYNIDNLYALEEINLSGCEIKKFPIYSKMLNLKKLILFKNKFVDFPVNFKLLRNNLEILDLRENPLKIVTTKMYIGALGLLENFYGKVLMDESLIQIISKLSFDTIISQKYKTKTVYFKKLKENKINDEFNKYIKSKILEKNNKKIKEEVDKIMELVVEMRDSGFISFEETMEQVMEIMKVNYSKHYRIKHVLLHLEAKFSSKFYKFLEAVLFKYKIEKLKSALINIYDSEEHLNYWIYHLRDILSFTEAKPFEENSQIHNDKNIIFWSFINITDSYELVNIIKLELEKDEEMVKIFSNLLQNMHDRFRELSIDDILKRMGDFQRNPIKYILKKYQIIG